MKNHLKIAGIVAGTALIATTAGAVPAGANNAAIEALVSQQPRATSGHSLAGVWTATIDPLPNPAGDQPPFESTLAFGHANTLNEITSKVTSTSAGLGAWEKVEGSTYRTRWLKYRFDGTGAYIGKTVVTEQITLLDKRHYEGRARTQIIDTTGVVVAQFESEVVAERLTP